MLRRQNSYTCHRDSGKKNILPSITFNKEPLDPVQCVRNLGVIFDDQLTMQNHISNMCRSSSYALHMIGKVRKYLDQATTEKLVHAFVMSRLDNCNSLLIWIASIPPLQNAVHTELGSQNCLQEEITRSYISNFKWVTLVASWEKDNCFLSFWLWHINVIKELLLNTC